MGTVFKIQGTVGDTLPPGRFPIINFNAVESQVFDWYWVKADTPAAFDAAKEFFFRDHSLAYRKSISPEVCPQALKQC